MVERSALRIGERVQYTERGLAQLQRKQRTGVIIGYTRDGGVRVRWDGQSRATSNAYAAVFIERVSAE